MAAAKKKAVVKTAVKITLNAEEFGALRRALETARKPTAKQVQGYFEEVIDRAIEDLINEHGEPDAEED